MDSNDLVSEALIPDEISLNIITNGVCQREKWLLIPAFDELGDICTGVVLILRLQVLWHFDKFNVWCSAKCGKDGLNKLNPGVSLA